MRWHRAMRCGGNGVAILFCGFVEMFFCDGRRRSDGATLRWETAVVGAAQWAFAGLCKSSAADAENAAAGVAAAVRRCSCCTFSCAAAASARFPQGSLRPHGAQQRCRIAAGRGAVAGPQDRIGCFVLAGSTRCIPVAGAGSPEQRHSPVAGFFDPVGSNLPIRRGIAAIRRAGPRWRRGSDDAFTPVPPPRLQFAIAQIGCNG
ncbi:hypothetical protein [Tahibacter harae]|uniref:Uncharacterized protein n=1 Tax=Tahibacter harae TaxID=2963937 RepID=A0ABT1QP75_9GAMM|nr:hypothetical protein [Tahibacter harae]MCQ4164083.1 hypothetical protein [Tahibacter harae]